jgi:hypothetical protein
MVFGLSAASVAAVEPDEAVLAKYGFDKPFGRVEMDIVGGNFAMNFGNEVTDDEGKVTGRYGMVDGIDVIYTFNTASIPWASVMPLDITTSIITSNYIFDLDGVSFKGSGYDETFKITGTDNKDFAVTRNGSAVDPDAFKLFYQFLLRAPAEELYLDETTAPPDFTVHIYGDGIDDTLEFVKSANRRSVIIINGVPSFSCKTAYVNRLIENLGLLTEGKPIIETW